MKSAIAVVITIAVLVAVLYGMFQLKGCQQWRKHLASSTIGLDRTITLYANDGSVIKHWTGRVQVETEGGFPRFIVDGKVIFLNGTFVIEEKFGFNRCHGLCARGIGD